MELTVGYSEAGRENDDVGGYIDALGRPHRATLHRYDRIILDELELGVVHRGQVPRVQLFSYLSCVNRKWTYPESKMRRLAAMSKSGVSASCWQAEGLNQGRTHRPQWASTHVFLRSSLARVLHQDVEKRRALAYALLDVAHHEELFSAEVDKGPLEEKELYRYLSNL